MSHPVVWLAMTVAVIAHTLAAICFKTAAQQKGRLILKYFLIGNIIGFLGPLCTAIALRNNNPNLVLATMEGIGGVFFVVVLNRVFNERLTGRQWLSIFVLIFGTVLLQFGPDSHLP